MALVPRVVSAVRLPVVASGGLMGRPPHCPGAFPQPSLTRPEAVRHAAAAERDVRPVERGMIRVKTSLLTRNDTMHLSISASHIKHWFQYRCERKLVYEAMDVMTRNSIPVLEQQFASSAHDFGKDFEREVIRHYRQHPGVAVLEPPSGENALDENASASFLRGANLHTAAHQLLLSETKALRRRLGLEDFDVRLSRGIVDLLLARVENGQRRLRIVDIKATDVALPFHKVQVAWYAWMLRGVLESSGVNAVVDDIAAIWHRPPTPRADGRPWEEAPFLLRNYEPLILDWVQHELRQAVTRRVERGHDDTRFHIYFKCEQCQFLTHCQKTISDEKPREQWDISAVPGVSHQSKATLGRSKVRNVGTLCAAGGRIFDTEPLDWRLATQGRSILERAQALMEGKVRRAAGRVTLRMPHRTNVQIHLVADHNPTISRLATLGVLIIEKGQETARAVRLVRSREEEAAALREVLGVVLDALRRTHEANQLGQKCILHLFVYEPAESRDIAAALGRHLDDPGLLSELVELVRLFPPEEVIPEPEYRGYHHLPASALRGILEEVFALPVKVSYDLARVSAALASHQPAPGAPYTPAEPFARPFSSRLALPVCQDLVEGKADEVAVRQDVERRLAAMHGLVDWLERVDAALPAPERFLRLRKAPFRLYATVDPLRVRDLDVLLAQALLANRAELLQTLTELARPVETRRERGNCMCDMRLLKEGDRKGGRHWFLFQVPPDAIGAEFSPSDPMLLLTDGHPDHLLDPNMWGAFQVRMRPPLAGNPPNNLLLEMSADAFHTPAFQSLRAKLGTRGWVLDKGFFDINTRRLESFLRHVAGAQP
ncbi:PD-(D/E)XK nuclease family protein [Cystobacter fuscus]|uniref:PD-(D/E)XK nuclease family protein n=1 Tax=Cystobacter fuscus TaxID=43 RepID=UPI0037BEF4F8